MPHQDGHRQNQESQASRADMAEETILGGRKDPVLLKIDGVRRAVVSWAIGWGYLWVCLLAAALTFAGVLADHAFVLQKWSRLAFFRAFVLAVGGGAVLATFYPLLRRMGRLYVARRMEQQHPELKNALISYLQCRDDPRMPGELKGMMRRKAAATIQSLDTSVVVERGRYVRLSLVLGGLVVAFLLYLAFSPKSAAVSLRRLMQPGRDILPPTSTRLAEIEPGEIYVITGDRPRLMVRVEGARPQSVYAVWSGETFEAKRVLLAEKEGARWEGAFPPVLEGGSYYVAAGDTRSDRFGVTVLPRPAVSALSIRVRPPAYTALPARTESDGNLEVPAGTEIDLRATTNLPPASGYLEFDSGRRVWLNPSAGGAALEGNFGAQRSDGYSVHFESVAFPGGVTFKNMTPVNYRLTVLEDRPPEAELLGPPDGIEVGPAQTVRVRYRAEDDYGVVRARLRYALSPLLSPTLTMAEGEPRRSVEGEYEWDLTTVPARPGMTLTYHVEAEDNRPGVPQVGRSEERRIVVTGEPDAAAGEEESPGEQQRAPAPDMEPGAEGEGDRPEAPAGGEPSPAEHEGAGALEDLRERAQRIAEALDAGRESEGRPSPGGEAAGEAAQDARPQQDGEEPPAGQCPDGASEGDGECGGGGAEGEGGKGAPGGAGAGDAGAGEGPTSGQGGEAGTEVSESGEAGAEGRGVGVRRLPGPGAPERALPPEALDRAIEELARMMEQDDLPRGLLKDLGTDRGELARFIDRYRRARQHAERAERAEPEPRPDAEGRVLAPAGPAAEGVRARDAAPPGEKDELRSRFEGAGERLSPRYRDVVNRYYEALSGER